MKVVLILFFFSMSLASIAQKTLLGQDKSSPFAVTYESLKLYPNPVISTSKIEFRLQERSQVQITLLNILGAQTKNLLNEARTAGIQSIQFSANQLERGTYFLRLSINGEIIKTIRVAVAPQ